jgi:hypothetical protein
MQQCNEERNNMKTQQHSNGAGTSVTSLSSLILLLVMALSAMSQTGRPPPPRLAILHFSRDSGVTIRAFGSGGRTNVVEASSDLITWMPIATNVFDYSLCPICPFVDVQDRASTNLAHRFYRCYELY